MTADLLMTQLLEAVEVGDDGVWLEKKSSQKGLKSQHHFTIMHPKHGSLGVLSGNPSEDGKEFKIHYMSATSPDGDSISPTAIKAGLRSLISHFHSIEVIEGDNRITGIHALASLRTGGDSNTKVKIPNRMLRGAR